MSTSINHLKAYCKKVSNYKLLTRKEERRLLSTIKDSSSPEKERLKARELFINSNLRLVMAFAKRYSKIGYLEDLISSGNYGLIEALDKFDLKRGNKFSTYATWYIRKEILDYLSKFVFNSSKNKYYLKKLTETIEDEVFQTEGIKLKSEEIVEILRKNDSYGYKSIGMHTYYSLLKNTLSLDDKVNFLKETLQSNYDSAVTELENMEAVNHVISELLTKLNTRELDVIKSRYGIGTNKETLEQIGKRIKVSKERVRQIELRALDKMRGSTKFKLISSQN